MKNWVESMEPIRVQVSLAKQQNQQTELKRNNKCPTDSYHEEIQEYIRYNEDWEGRGGEPTGV